MTKFNLVELTHPFNMVPGKRQEFNKARVNVLIIMIKSVIGGLVPVIQSEKGRLCITIVNSER